MNPKIIVTVILLQTPILIAAPETPLPRSGSQIVEDEHRVIVEREEMPGSAESRRVFSNRLVRSEAATLKGRAGDAGPSFEFEVPEIRRSQAIDALPEIVPARPVEPGNPVLQNERVAPARPDAPND